LIQDAGRGMRNARPNLLARTQLTGRAVEVFLKRNKCDITVQTALLCASPKMFVDSIRRPSVRVILSDAIEKYVASWPEDSAGLSGEEVHHIANLLLGQPEPTQPIVVEPAVVEPVEEEGQLTDSSVAAKPIKKQSDFDAIFGKINFTTRQWSIIGVLVAMLVCVLVTFIAISILTLR